MSVLSPETRGKIHTHTCWVSFLFFQVMFFLIVLTKPTLIRSTPHSSAGIISGVMNSLALILAVYLWLKAKPRFEESLSLVDNVYAEFGKSIKRKIHYIYLLSFSQLMSGFGFVVSLLSASAVSGLPATILGFGVLFLFSPLRWGSRQSELAGA